MIKTDTIEAQITKQPEEPETIPKRLAALELYKSMKVTFNTGMVFIAGCFIVAIVSNFSKSGGASSAGIISAGVGFLLWKTKQKMTYYKNKYRLAV